MRGRARQLRGAFRQTRVPAAAQKFAGCFQINFEGAGVLAFLPATSSSADRLPPALLGSFLRASETRRTILAGRSLEEASKQLSVDGALGGFWDGGKPGRGSLRSLPRGRRGCDAPERRELAEPGGASVALRGVGAAPGAELRKPPRPAGGVSRTRARRPGVAQGLRGGRVLSLQRAVSVHCAGGRE